MMRRIIFCVIIAMSISLAFSAGKPCCNKKAGKKVVSCKFNHTALKVDQDLSGELTTLGSDNFPQAYKCNTADGSKCAKSGAKKTWWKFWAKKSQKNCPCKQATAEEAVGE